MSTKIFVDLGPAFCVLPLRARAEINSHFGASAGQADARRRDEGDVGHRRGAATKQMPARRRAPGGLQQNVKLFLREPLTGFWHETQISYPHGPGLKGLTYRKSDKIRARSSLLRENSWLMAGATIEGSAG